MVSLQSSRDYERVAKAIAYLTENASRQPSLAEVAQQVSLSEAHFQRLFQRWAGVSPKRFLQYVNLNRAKALLTNSTESVDAVSEAVGLSGSSRLHDLFVTLEGMTPACFRDGGAAQTIQYSFADTRFGQAMVANTTRGLCALFFCDNVIDGKAQLQKVYSQAQLIAVESKVQRDAVAALNGLGSGSIALHVKGTVFQLKVWEALLQIPYGRVCSYGNIAASLQQNHAARAVGTAVGSNLIAGLVPCHRVIQKTGALGGYRWGVMRKATLLAWEAMHVDDG